MGTVHQSVCCLVHLYCNTFLQHNRHTMSREIVAGVVHNAHSTSVHHCKQERSTFASLQVTTTSLSMPITICYRSHQRCNGLRPDLWLPTGGAGGGAPMRKAPTHVLATCTALDLPLFGGGASTSGGTHPPNYQDHVRENTKKKFSGAFGGKNRERHGTKNTHALVTYPYPPGGGGSG